MPCRGRLTARLAPVDVLVFAPHPDDEVIGTGGLVLQAIAAGKSVRIVFVTNGDGYPRAASALLHTPIPELGPSDFVSLGGARQQEAVAAAELIGLDPAGVVFLGYPDAGLAGICAEDSAMSSGDPVASPFTGLTSTYGPAHTDYHTLAHGRPGLYTRSEIAADMAEILRQSQPASVYVTDAADDHLDHKSAFALVNEAAASIGYSGTLFTFIAHSGEDGDWPWPRGAAPDAPFEAHSVAGSRYPKNVPWPPPVRVALTPDQAAVKQRAIAAHSSQWTIDRQYLESFVKSEEVFWTRGLT
jgi:LmbE family N-acetylglucosaminyl deacetylase